MQLIDSHCHFDFEAFDNDRASLWRSAQRAGVEALLIPGIHPLQWSKAQTICQQLPAIVMAAGLHPWWLANWRDTINDSLASNVAGIVTPAALQQLCNVITQQTHQPDCVAIGECGLDAMIDTPLEQQQAVFEAQLALACELKLPLIIHARKTHHHILTLLKRYRPAAGGVIHAFTGSQTIAEHYWQLGFYLGVGGAITYPRANKTRNAIAAMPLEALLLETDAPDMPINGRQGQANSPAFLPEIAACLATLTNNTVEAVAQQTSTNSRQLFGQW